VTDRTSPIKRTKATSKKPRKRSKKTHDSSDDDESDSESGSELEEEEGDVEMVEEGESADVVGRGGRRGAKVSW
jgi:hypothetical protein